MSLPIIFAYIIFTVAAIISVINESGDEEWISLLTNGALGLTSIYTYSKKRYDLSILSMIVMCTSIIWHSSGKYNKIDDFMSRYLAYYTLGTTAFNPVVIGVPMLFLSTLLTYNIEFEEMYVVVSLSILLIVYKIINNTMDYRFVFGSISGILAFVCFHLEHWHSVWHVLSAICVAVLCTQNVKLKKVVVNIEENKEILLRF